MNRLKQILLEIILLIFLSVFLNNNILAQDADSIDVKYLVHKQIEEAKKKSLAVSTVKYEAPAVTTPAPKVVTESNTIVGIPGDYFFKGMIMLTASVLVFSWVGMRKAKRERIIKNNQYKRNIKLMREEKFIKEIDPKLKEIRTRLTLTSVVLNEDKKISAAARKSFIGKEEILLASRLRSHGMQYGGQRSLA